MESCKEASTPMPSSCYMDADAAGKGVDQTKYRGLTINVGRISCFSYVFVQDIKQIQRKLTSKMQKEFLNISNEQPMLVYGILLTLLYT